MKANKIWQIEFEKLYKIINAEKYKYLVITVYFLQKLIRVKENYIEIVLKHFHDLIKFIYLFNHDPLFYKNK